MVKKKSGGIIETNRCVIYIRVSSHEQERGYSLSAQEKLLRKPMMTDVMELSKKISGRR